MIIPMSLFSKSFVFMFSVLRTFINAKPVFKLNSSDLKSVFEKLRFGDGSLWTVETELRFHISQAQFGLAL